MLDYITVLLKLNNNTEQQNKSDKKHGAYCSLNDYSGTKTYMYVHILKMSKRLAKSRVITRMGFWVYNVPGFRNNKQVCGINVVKYDNIKCYYS